MPRSQLKLQLDELLPYGMIATKKWLSFQGMSLHAIDNALKSKKLDALAVGVYARTGMPVTWQGAVSSLQRMSEYPLHVGGLTALELLGLGHYLSSEAVKTVHLYSEEKLPTWLSKLNPGIRYEWHGTKRLWSTTLAVLDKYSVEYSSREDLPPLLVSCPEKAYLEMLMGVPDSVSVDHADELMQGMTSFSPKKLDALLKCCRNVKVKRLFFWLAQRHSYAWSKKLKGENYDLGKGKREISKGGKLDKRYLITVPEHLHGSK